jgi:hypothetical protein
MSVDLARSLEDLQPFEHNPYASFLKGRSGGDFKRHKTIGHARNATSAKNVWNRGYSPDTDIFRWDDDTKRWVSLSVDTASVPGSEPPCATLSSLPVTTSA